MGFHGFLWLPITDWPRGVYKRHQFENPCKSSITDVVLDDITLPNILTINLDFNLLSGLTRFLRVSVFMVVRPPWPMDRRRMIFGGKHSGYFYGNETELRLFLAVNEKSFQLPNLINLSLKNNRIQVLGKTSLRYLKNLKSINLSGNPLYWVSPSAFWPNKALKQAGFPGLRRSDSRIRKISRYYGR